MKKSILTLLVLFVCVIQTTTAYEYFTIYFNDGTKSEAFYATYVDSICYSKIGLDSIAYDDWQVQEIYTIDSVYRYPLAQIDSLSFKDVDVNKSFDILNELFSITPNGQQLEIEDVIMYVKKHYDNANIEICDCIIYLDIEGCETLRLDIYGKYMMESSDWVLDSLTLSNRMDSIMNVLGRDVQDTISTILSDSVFSEDDFNYSQSRQLNHRRSAPTNVTNNTTILTNNNLLIWSPWYYTESKYEHKLVFETLNTFANNINKRRPDILKLSPIQANGASLASIASMKSFSNYDVVFIDCHGTENGELIMPITKETEKIPGDVVGIWDNDTKKMIPGKVLDEKYMRRYLPNKLDHTILFTAMCYAYPSENHRSYFWSIANERKVADFMGATNKVTIKTPLERFTEFATTFFLGGTPTTKAFKNRPYTDTYKREDKTYKATGEYKHTINFVDVFYGYARPLPYNKQNQSMKGRMPLPQNYLSQAHAREGFRSAKSISSNFSNNVEAGFMLKNRTTGDVQLIPLTINNVTDYQIYPLGDLMEDIVFEVKTDGLKPGHYAYSTYIWNGESLKLSNEAQEFIIEDDNAEAYYVWDEVSNTATYYYDGMRESRFSWTIKIDKRHYVDNSCEKVIFDSSFADYYPHYFCFSARNLTNIENLNYLNTDSITNMSLMFNECNSLKSLDLSSFNTSRVIDMGYMFHGCSSLTSLDLSSFNTSRVTYMGYMFHGCSSLTSLDLSNFDMSNVEIGYTFGACKSLKTLDMSNYHASEMNTDDIKGIFNLCESLTTLNMSNFNVPKMTDMSYFFSPNSHATHSLKSINLSNANLVNVTNMDKMFYGCTSLKEINLSGCITSNVTSMAFMFSGCRLLEQLDISSLKTEKVETMAHMFEYCESLTNLDLSFFNTSNLKTIDYMFNGCSSLQYLNIDGFKTSDNDYYLTFKTIFLGCESLETLDMNYFTASEATSSTDALNLISLKNLNISHFYAPKMKKFSFRLISLEKINISYLDAPELTDLFFNDTPPVKEVDMSNCNAPKLCYIPFQSKSIIKLNMSHYNASGLTTTVLILFSNMVALETLDMSNFYAPNLIDIDLLTYNLESLQKLDISNFYAPNITDMSYMFNGLKNLTEIKLDNFPTENVTNMAGMFEGCSSLKNLDLSGFNTSKVESMSGMFSRCSSLYSLDLSGFNTSKVESMIGMFEGCSSLKTIFGNDWSSNMVENASWMFEGCTKLVGGAGTKLGENIYYEYEKNSDGEIVKIKRTYWCYDEISAAHIDGGKDNPGLFTAK